MFGLLKGASCGLSNEYHREWWQHICGVCLALHRNVGQVGRLTTNYDSALLSLVTSQQMIVPTPVKQGMCALRRPIQANTVAPDAVGAQFGGALALIMGSIKLKDQLADGDIGRRSAKRLPAEIAAAKWEKQGRSLASKLRFDCQPLFQLAESQFALEARPGQPFATYVRPTEQAVGFAFAHTAVLAQQPQNIPLLKQIGETYGRLMFLLDSYKDFDDDVRQGKFNALAERHDHHSFKAAAQSLWRDAHQRLTDGVLELNGRKAHLSTTLLAKQLNRIGERTLRLPHSCAVCFSGQTTHEYGDDDEEVKRKNQNSGCGCYCCSDCFVCCDCGGCCCDCGGCDCGGDCCDGDCCTSCCCDGGCCCECG